MNESILVEFFGRSPFIKIIDALLDGIGADWSKKQLQEMAGISKATLFQHWPKIEKAGIVRVTRTFGKTKLYTLNTQNQTVKDLIKLELNMIEATSPKKQKIAARSI